MNQLLPKPPPMALCRVCQKKLAANSETEWVQVDTEFGFHSAKRLKGYWPLRGHGGYFCSYVCGTRYAIAVLREVDRNKAKKEGASNGG